VWLLFCSSSKSYKVELEEKLRNFSMTAMKIEVDFRLDEATIWDPQDAFIDSLATKVFYIVPAFICGVLVGTIIWAFYILIFKFSNGCVKNNRNSGNENRSHRDSSATSETNSTSANSVEVT